MRSRRKWKSWKSCEEKLKGKDVTKSLIPLLIILCLTGCDDRFRYPCQDPKNWDATECKPPICTASGTCPEMLVKPEEKK